MGLSPPGNNRGCAGLEGWPSQRFKVDWGGEVCTEALPTARDGSRWPCQRCERRGRQTSRHWFGWLEKEEDERYKKHNNC